MDENKNKKTEEMNTSEGFKNENYSERADKNGSECKCDAKSREGNANQHANQNVNQNANQKCNEKHENESEKNTKAETISKAEYDKKVLELETSANDFKDRWYRVSAEFDNYKKRTASAESTAYKNGKIDAVIKLLPIGDNLERALNMPLDDNNKAGIAMLLKNFTDVLKTLDVTEINPINEKFNPHIAEAVMQVEPTSGEESENVKAVFEKGYKMGDKVIRYAKVSVVK